MVYRPWFCTFHRHRFAAELSDFITEDLSKLFPREAQDAKITVIEALDHILTTYDQRYAPDFRCKAFTHTGRSLSSKYTGTVASVAISYAFPFAFRCAQSINSEQHGVLFTFSRLLPFP